MPSIDVCNIRYPRCTRIWWRTLIYVMTLTNFWRFGECVIEHHQWHSHTVTAEQRMEWKQLRLIIDNTSPYGELDTNKFQRAILQCRNAPDQDTKLSPAMILSIRPIRYFILVLPGKYRTADVWVETSSDRERAPSIRHAHEPERLTQTRKSYLLWKLVIMYVSKTRQDMSTKMG